MYAESAPILRIVLADDPVVVREGIRVVLQQEGFDIVGTAGDGYGAVEMCEALQPDVALLDVSMPLLNGIDAGREIRKVCPATKVILLTMHGEDLIVFAGLRAGVSGFVLKSVAASTLVHAIEAVWQNEVYLSPGISRTIVDTYLTRHAPPAPRIA